MRKFLISFFVFITIVFCVSFFHTDQSSASGKNSLTKPVLIAQIIGGIPTPPPADGTWLPDSEVTFAGKNASRSKDLFNWTLLNYKWAYQDNPLVDFWVKIRNIVFAFLILLVLIAAFSMIVSGGQSLRSVVFVRKFIFVVLLIAFSFAMIRFFYQINDVIIGFFVRNPDGNVISSKDLLNISFDYVTFTGYRRYGMQYDEAAFVSLLLVKITAFTYFVMAAILLIRKVILWFFITVSPIYPLLLFYYPIRNTAKIWIGEFFRWLLYAPLFTIFLNALVQLWRSNINILPFNFATKAIVYPTAVNILLGGPGQTLAIDNNINYNDTFAQYVVALIMVWVVILLPFLLLKIFLDYLSSININKDAALSYINNARNYITNRDMFNNKTPGPPPSRPPSQPTGAARILPFLQTGSAKQIPQGNTVTENTAGSTKTINQTTNQTANTTYNVASKVSNRAFTSVPRLKTEQLSAQTLQLMNFPIPTMRDVARFETQKLTSSVTSREQASQMHETLEKIANPYTITNTQERQQFSQIREKLFQQKVKGDTLASSILNAANNITNISNVSNASSVMQTTQANNQKVLNQTLQKLANPSVITNSTERQQFNQIKEQLIKEQQTGNPIAASVMSSVNNLEQVTNVQNANQTQFNKSLQSLVNPSTVTNTTERQQYMKVKDILQQQSKQGNQAANTLLSSSQNQQSLTNILQKISNTELITNTTERQQYTQIKDLLVKEQKNGNNVATSILNTINNTTNTTKESSRATTQMQQTLEKLANPDRITNRTEKEQYTKLKEELKQQSQNGNPLATSLLRAAETKTQVSEASLASTLLPVTNQVQTVNLDDYEEVKNMWNDNYRNVEVPKSIEKPDRSRSEWITEDRNQISETINLLTSSDQTQVSQGMERVSTLLPFLLIGGFSQTEVVAYLKAKQKAADEVLEQLKNVREEEETKLSTETVRKKKQTMVQHQSVDLGNTSETYEGPEESQLENMQTAARTINLRPELLNTKTLSLVNFPIPTMHDVARYEAAKIASNNPSNQSLAEQLTKTKQDIDQAYEILHKIANPSVIENPEERQQYEQMRAIITQEQKEGNPLASSIMSVADTFSEANIQSSEPASQLTLPAQNQVQTVNLDDYEDVKKMWLDNYKNIDVPQSMEHPSRTRIEWVNDDLNQIKETVNMLTSEDQNQVTEGMKQVSALLPFLLIGGFSQTEVIAYLKAKQNAAEETLELLKNANEEEETNLGITATRNRTHVAQYNKVESEDGENQTTQGIESIGHVVNLRPELLNSKTLSLINLPIPTMRDVAKYEAAKLSASNNPSLADELEQAKLNINQAYEILQKIANPSNTQDQAERQQYEQIRQTIIQEKNEGNPLASSILSVTNAFSNNSQLTSPKQDIVTVLQKIEYPDEITTLSEKNYYSNLKETLLADNKNGSPLAAAILSAAEKVKEIDESTTQTEEEKILQEVLVKIDNPAVALPAERFRYEQLKEQLLSQSKQNDPFAIIILLIAGKIGELKLKQTTISPSEVTLPMQNQVQTVNLDDYEDVRKMWVENYSNIDVPQSMEHPDRTRAEWIKEDIERIDHAIELLTSNDPEKVKEGLKIVSSILPFLLIGGFSVTEIIAYLKAKKNAGQEVLDTMENENSDNTLIDNTDKKDELKDLTKREEIPTSQPDEQYNPENTQNSDESIQTETPSDKTPEENSSS